MLTLRSEKGFTLIESIIALAVLAVSLLGLAQLMAVALRQNAFARSNTMAITLAQEKLEELRTKYNTELESGTANGDLTSGTHGPNEISLTAPAGSTTGDYRFEVGWEVTITGKQKTIQVTVAPIEQNELTSKTISVTTVFSP